jgi:hypothetical protein
MTYDVAQNYRSGAESDGVTIHELQTELGAVCVTLDGPDTGRIWADEPLVVNGIAHTIAGHYRLFDAIRGFVKGKWAEYDQPQSTVSIGSYPGIRRTDRAGWSDGAQPTDNARQKIGRTIGAALRAYIDADTLLTDSDLYKESLANARELAAKAQEREARYKRESAAREIKAAEKLEEEAARIRAGGEFKPVQ